MSVNLFEGSLSKNFFQCYLVVMNENIKMMTQKNMSNMHIDENCESCPPHSKKYCSNQFYLAVTFKRCDRRH